MGAVLNNDVRNLKATRGIWTDVIASRPAAGIRHRIFIGNDDLNIYLDDGLVWHQIGAGGGVPIVDARNGVNDLTLPNTVELGGPLIKHTDITGAFNLGFGHTRTVFGGTAASATVHKVYINDTQSAAVSDGQAALLAQGNYTPTAAITVNVAGLVGTLSLNLGTAIVSGADALNAAGNLSSLVLVNNSGAATTRRLRANLAGIVLNGNVNATSLSAYEAKSVEVAGVNTVTNVYGLYIGLMKASGVTNGYGIYQSDSLDTNIFFGTISCRNATFANSERFGTGSSVTAINTTALGAGASCTVGNSVAMGTNALAQTGAGAIAIGQGAISSGGIAIGKDSVSPGASSVCIGGTVTVDSGTAVGVGTVAGNACSSVGQSASASAGNGTAIGYFAAANFNPSVAIGHSSSATAANQFVCGANGIAINHVHFGTGVVAVAPEQITIHGSGASGTNIAGASIAIAGGKATGNAVGGGILFQTSDAGASGTTLQTLSSKLTITTDGRLFGSALHNNAGAVTGTVNQYIASGTYTPTLTNVTNVAASTAFLCQWIRVGNVVTVSGKVSIDPTAATATELGVSLPIASALTAEQQLAGVAVTGTAAQDAIRIRADATNDRAAFVYTAISTANIDYSFTFEYLIL